MKTTVLTLCSVLLYTSVIAQFFDVDTLVYNGDTNKRINCVILGDGYKQDQLQQFKLDAEEIVEGWFGQSPFLEYRNFFNVFMISVPSNQEGAAENPNQLIDNYFGSTFNYGGIQRLLVPMRTDRISSVLAANFPEYDQVVMIVNSSEYGGSGGWVATASTHFDAKEIAYHELGHSFGGLADEYWAGLQYAAERPNMTGEASPGKVKWKNWFGEFGIGVFPYPENQAWFKPHENCKMRYLGEPFCAVCREQLVFQILKTVSPVEEYFPNTTTTVEEVMDFSLSLIEPDPNTLKIQWYLNSEIIKEDEPSLELHSSQLDAGQNVLEAIVYDLTTFDRRPSIYVTTVRWDISTQTVSSDKYVLKARPTETPVTSIDGAISHYSLQIFPNPVSDILHFEYTVERPSTLEFSLHDSEGKNVLTILPETRLPGTYQDEMEISSLPSGLYFLNIKDGSFTKSFRIIKKQYNEVGVGSPD